MLWGHTAPVSYTHLDVYKRQVQILCTTNDPCEDLHYHRLLREENFSVQVLPTFRPDKAYLIGKEDYPQYLDALGKAWGNPISCLSDLKEALSSRLDFFIREGGCLLSDHSLEGCIYACLLYTSQERIVTFLSPVPFTECVFSDCSASAAPLSCSG